MIARKVPFEHPLVAFATMLAGRPFPELSENENLQFPEGVF